MSASDFTGVLAQVAIALTIKTNDPAAIRLKKDAENQIALVLQAKETENKFQAAVAACQLKWQHTNLDGALENIRAALKVRPDDPMALKLKADVEKEKMLAAKAAENEEKIQATLQSGRAAFERNNFDAALTLARAALASKPGDNAAEKLMGDSLYCKAKKL